MSLISTTVNSRRASTIPEARTKKRVYQFVDGLEAVEKSLIESARKVDESDKDFAKGEKDMVILTEDLFKILTQFGLRCTWRNSSALEMKS